MNQRYVFYALSIGLVLLAASLGYTRVGLNDLEKSVESQAETIAALNDKMKPYDALYNLLKDKPGTSFLAGLKAVSGASVIYNHDLSKERSSRFNHDYYSIFYSPVENVTLHIVSGKILPYGDFPFPLTLQKGNAVLNESSERIEINHIGLNTTEVIWQSQIIWQRNVTGTESYDIVLDDVGWYTLSMTGPISRTSSGATRSRFMLGSVNNTVQVAEIWVDYLLYHNDEIVLFGLWTH